MAYDPAKDNSAKFEPGPFARIPQAVLESRAYLDLPLEGRQLCTDVLFYYRGANNASLRCSFGLMKRERGWRCHQRVFERAKEALLRSKLMVEIRPPGRVPKKGEKGNGKAPEGLYELTFLARDSGEHGLPRKAYPSGLWRTYEPQGHSTENQPETTMVTDDDTYPTVDMERNHIGYGT